MIVSQGAKPHLCRRCQFILKKRHLPFAIQLLQKSTEGLCQFNEEHKLLTTKVPTEKNSGYLYSSFETNLRKNERTFHPTSRPKFVERVEQIEGKIGEPTKIIILRDNVNSKNTYERKYEELKENIALGENDASEEKLDAIDIMDQLGNENGLVTMGQAFKNIDNIRPEEELLEDLKEFNALVEKLSDGFTSSQLLEYIRNFETNNNNEQVPGSAPTSSEKKRLSITPWRPGISTAQDYFDNDLQRGYPLESRTNKHLIAIRLMLECWKVEVSSLMEGLGQFEIRLGASTLEVLLLGGPAPLQSFHDRVLILEGEGLEVFRSRKTMRITTTKARKYHIVREMENLVNQVEIRIISLADLMPAPGVEQWKESEIDVWIRNMFNDQALAEVRRLTGVVISRYKDFKIVLASLPKESRARESPINTACRLLVTTRLPMSPIKYSLASADQSTAAPIDYSQVDGMNWWCRTRKWLRWVTPISKEAGKSPTAPLTESPIRYLCSGYEDVIDNPNTESLSSAISRNKIALKNQKIPKLFTSTFATLGAVIHTHADSQCDETSSIYTNRKKFITEFSTHVPNVTLLLSFAEFDKTARAEEQVVLRFLPNPFTEKGSKLKPNKSLFKAVRFALPIIELNFRMDRKSRARYAYAKAIVDESQTDVMLPQETADIRFHQKTTSPLCDASLASIKSFIGRCELDFNPGGNITIPPSIELPIPANLCQEEELNRIKHRKGRNFKLPMGPEDLIKGVEYLFSGLEIRRRLLFKYESWNLEYTYINAGKSGGTRGELSLRPVRNGKGTSDQDFVNFGLDLACRVTSFSTPDMTRFRGITKVESPLIRKYVPVHQLTSDYPRSFLYIPRRILCDRMSNEKSPSTPKVGAPSDINAEAWEFDDELDDFEIYGENNPVEIDPAENDLNDQIK